MQTYVEKLRRAAARREPIRADRTNALRLIDGSGDGFANLEIDDFAGRWLAQARSAQIPEWLRDLAPVSLYWKRLGEKTSPQWISGERQIAPFVVREHQMQFWIDFNAGYSQGLFIDQRNNRRQVRELARGAKVLNCFAYTCAFGVAAALGGGRTTNIDLSGKYLEWGKKNYALNGLRQVDHEFLRGDVFDWLQRFFRKQQKFDLIILDPPTFSHDKRGRVFRVESDFPKLASAAAPLLKSGGAMLCTTNQRSLSTAGFRKILARNLAGRWRFSATSMPADFRGDQFLKSFWLEEADADGS